MTLSPFDLLTFIVFIAAVVGISLYVSRKEKTEEDYFLAGRRLTWALIGFSLIASNISTEHFVGMAGRAFTRVGLAIASYEWMSAITLVIVAWWLLPKFLRVGIYTMPEYLEYRYDRATRTIMATYLMVGYIVALLATVLYSGARGLDGVFGFSDHLRERFGLESAAAGRWATIGGIWFIGIVAAIYTIYGGLKAVVWSDLIQGAALLLGGALCLFLGLKLLGGGELLEEGGVAGGSLLTGWQALRERALIVDAQTGEIINRLSVLRPWNDPEVPWLAVFVGGLWIPNLFYWGLNQFITQRALGAKSLAEGQRGIFLCCIFKLMIPFIIVIPGIIAFEVFGDAILQRAGGDVSKAGEQAYPYLITHIVPPFLRGVMLAALAGAVMSTFNSGVNSASTIFTIDIYKRYVNPHATPKRQVSIGRIATAVIAVFACLIAPLPGRFEGVFNYIQEIWGFISPGIVAAFLVGLVVKRAPAVAGRTALILGPILYACSRVPKWIMEGVYQFKLESGDGTTGVVRTLQDGTTQAVEGFAALYYRFCALAFLHHMAIVFIILVIVMVVLTAWRPRREPITYPTSRLDTHVPRSTYVLGVLICLLTVALYIIFR
ncbi:MAG TPA: solute:sodium symporter family transporter [Phycisphaerae bacterium]|nr:solute:sodium symporter family transporter [Phycisphaerae bacterium]HNU44033.1 solute:sodium symporter family transporter [Phycisphaerae bacterium]